EQTVAIGSTLTEEGRKELFGLLRRHLDVFAWKSADMTGVPRYIDEHRLNVHEGCLPVRKNKRGQAPERNKAISEEVRKISEEEPPSTYMRCTQCPPISASMIMGPFVPSSSHRVGKEITDPGEKL
nr:reverse transcriptase domain-containing protein [Tanacetum cinerariifolium]